MDLPRFSLQGKVALVTGGSRGIGEAIAVEFAKAGADIAVTSRKLPELERVAGEVRKLGRKALAVETHVGRLDQIEKCIATVMAEFGKIDILVNNAGTSQAIPALDYTERAWDAVMNLNLKGLFFMSQGVARIMKEKGGGSIINIASVSGIKSEVPVIAYSVSKAGVIMATKSMAIEWGQYHIRVNGIAPGPVVTRLYDSHFINMTEEQIEKAHEAVGKRLPARHVGQPYEIADAAIYLASDASSFMTGHTMVVDGGTLL
ncbi:MAG: glucose 1-dehydrogenase [Dehalococcoidales bacterium]|nr:glucose 1-dehydrogenase [Dehalococcoidales bacterium]